jgi:hypothetical protein
MKLYEKIIDGKQHIMPAKKIIIKNDGMQTINPTEEMILADGWVEYVTPVYEPTIEDYRRDKIREIERHDSSPEVNKCYINTAGTELSYWANKSERISLKSAVNDCIIMNRNTYRLDLRDIGLSVDIDCNKLLEMLSALELYAIDCYNKTTDHIFNVNNLNTIEEIKNYDYRSGYPEKLIFEI